MYKRQLKTYNLRKFADGKRKAVDVHSAGGGAGQILKAEVLDTAIIHIIESDSSYDRNSWPIVALSPRGKVFGASYTDVVAHLPALNLLILISLFGAVLLLVNIKRRGWLLPATAISLWLAVSIIVGGLVPAAIQRFRVVPDELNKELPYVDSHIDYTRLAYGLDNIEEKSFAASPDLSQNDISNNKQTVDNIRLWDPTVLAETYSQLQEIRAYYALQEVDVDRYKINGELTQVMVAARELDQTNLPAVGWVNERLQYTHGFGVVFSPANNVASQGQPDFYVKGVPATTTVTELEVEQPRIYFGESADSVEYLSLIHI